MTAKLNCVSVEAYLMDASNSIVSLRFRPSHAKQCSTICVGAYELNTCHAGLLMNSIAILVAFQTRSLA